MRSDSGLATQGRFDVHGKFRFDDHATARPAGLCGPGRRRAPGVAGHQRPRELRDGDRGRDPDAELSRSADRGPRPAGRAAAAGTGDRPRGAVPRHDLRAGDESLGLGRAGAGGLAADRIVCGGGRRPGLDLRPRRRRARGVDRDAVRAWTGRRSRCASCGRSSRCAWRHGCWWPIAITTAAGCPIRSAFTSTWTATAPRWPCRIAGAPSTSSAPGSVMSPHRDRWCGFFEARESERGLNPIDDYLYAVDARFSVAPGERNGIVVGLEPGRRCRAGDRRRRAGARCGVGGRRVRPGPCAVGDRRRRLRDRGRARRARRARRSSRAIRGSATGAATR